MTPTAVPCRSGHTDCTADCGWCKGTGYENRPKAPITAEAIRAVLEDWYYQDCAEES